jgi:hypothetical protein
MSVQRRAWAERVKYLQRLRLVYLHLLRFISVFLDQRKLRGVQGKDDIFVYRLHFHQQHPVHLAV